MNKIKRFVSLALVLCMVMAFLPVGVSAAEDASYAYNIVHVDAGRKYFTPGELKAIIDNAAEAGFNQVQLYLSDNQGFRFALDDMTLTTDYDTYDLTPALGDGYSDSTGKAPCGSGMYLTEEEMDDIIAYANGKGIDIVPCINVPGHMGAILEEFTGFRYKKSNYSVSKSSIDLSNQEAVAFALALTEKYAAYFASKGCKFYNVGADEYANDLSSMGFEGMGATLYTKFVQFLNDAAAIITDLGMTPRAFNDGFYYKDYAISIEPDKAYEICYWSSGWSGYDVAAASTIAAKGHKMINTHGDYYWVLGNTSWQCSASKAKQFNINTFQGSNIADPAGAMFCIWCDTGDADTAANVISKTESVIDAFGSVLPQVENLVEKDEDEPVVGNVTLTEGGVAVTASGLTSLIVSEAVAPVIEGAAEAVAWDVAPETADGPYTGEAEVSMPVPEDFNTERLGAFVVNADGSVTKLTGAYADGFYTYTCPHFSETGLYEAEAEPAAEELEERTITVTVGGTATDVIEGGDYTAEIDESRLDKTIALVGATFENVITGTAEAVKAATLTSGGTYIIGNGSGRYMVVNGTTISSTTDFEAATKFTVTGSDGNWKIQVGNYYLRHASNSLGVDTTNSNNTWSYDGTRFYYTTTGNWGGTTTYRLNTNSSGTWRVNTDSSSRQGAAYTVTPATTTPTTTVTFTGVKVGVTYVTVGNVRYTINVVAEDLSKVTPLTIEYWITNRTLTINGATSLKLSAMDAYAENGIKISEKIPVNGAIDGNTTTFWKTTRLDSANRQTTGAGDDETLDGTDFVYVRYYGGSWACSADGKTWSNVQSSDQLVAYYLQVTKVTDEITTQVVDYGVVPSTSYGDSLFVILDFAVKYESGDVTPTSFPTSKTIGYHCNSNSSSDLGNTVIKDGSTYYRKLGTIKAVETSEYEVYMITLTPSSDTTTTKLASKCSSATKYTYSGTEKVVWVDDEANLGNFAADNLKYTSPSGRITYTVGGEPNIAGLEIYQNQGMLVTYYVRAKATEDALTVHYMDKNEGVEFYSYNIAVKEGTTFKTNIGLADPWKGNLANGDVQNFYNRTQYVSSDLSTLSQVGAQYLYTEYECIKVERSADGKHVYLYYTFDPTVSFVIDFGLPMELTAADLSEKLEGVSIQDIAFSGSSYTTYGRLTDNGTSITYQPVKVMNGADYFTLLVTTDRAVEDILDEASSKIAFRVYIVPATTMHYEESFITLGGFEITGTPNAGSQETELAGNHKKQNYGFTAAYTAAGATNGTEAVSVINGTTANATAEFTFTGDGVEVYVNAAKDTGTMLALFHQNENGSESLTKLYQVDTAAQSGSSAVTGGQDVDSYNLPVISVNGLTYGTYRVKLMHTGAGHDLGEVRLDGFRVFNPLGNTSAKAYDESEYNPKYVEVRDEVLTGLNVSAEDIDNEEHYIKTVVSQVFAATNGSLNGALLLGNDKTMDATDLLNNGPKNELFLRKGESVSFDLGKATAQIGLKALNGQVSYTVNDVAGSITTSADMFYGSYTGKVTIVNTGDKILSVTKLKLFGGNGLQAVSEELVQHALQCMGIIEKPVCPFADVAEDSYYYDAVMWAAKEGITSGADATHFLPDALCQRAQVVTFLWRAAGSPEPETNVNPFVDVTEDSFFYKAVLWAAEKGITSGVDQNHFAPFTACSRAQVVTFLWRAEGCPKADAAIPFTDVVEGSYYAPAVQWAVENGITSGMSANIFGVNTTCNRAQIVSFLYRAK